LFLLGANVDTGGRPKNAILTQNSDIAITLNTYSHAIPAMEAEAAEKVAALVAGG
jgi:hypothetical protein